MARRQIKIGLAGLGNVGMGVYANIAKNHALLSQRSNADLQITKIAVRDVGKARDREVPAELLTDRWQDLVEDEDIDIIVELIGGIDEAKKLVRESVNRGKVVVSGNKALLAEHGQELFTLAREKEVPVYFEAAVAGGIPIIKAVQESLVGNRIEMISGIINGTCNYILTKMREEGWRYTEALKEAQELGYAEADPTLDVNGWDAGHKAILLASLASGEWVPADQAVVEGIENIRLSDIQFVETLGYTVKLLAIIRDDEQGRMEVRVQPCLVPHEHLLASVNGVFNAVMVQGDLVGETLFYGSGAGQDPTSSSVISDVVDAAIGLSHDEKRGYVPSNKLASVVPIEDTISRYYLRLSVENRPGVLAQVADIMGKHAIGITSVIQPETSAEVADLVLMLDDAPFGSMKDALAQVQGLTCTREEPTLLRMETFGYLPEEEV